MAEVKASIARSQPTPTPVAPPVPTPTLPAPTPGQVIWTTAPQVPRAELFKLPPPKAQLVRLPWKVGSLHRVVMPYNIEVTGRYKGVLSSEAKLPKNGNALGDMRMVGSTPWLWLVAPGASQADWIDP